MATRKRWSQHVTQTSDALTLDEGVFKRRPAEIARSLKRSAERSRRRKSTPFRSAMSMLTFYENRAGRGLSARQHRKIEAAKVELRKLFDREPSTKRKAGKKQTKKKPTAHRRKSATRKKRTRSAR